MLIISFLKKYATLFIIIGIIIIGATAYVNSLNNKFVWDDNESIVSNLHIRDWRYLPIFFSESISSGAGAPNNYWRPAILIIYSAEYHLWGLWTPGFHIVNIFFHLLTAILVFFFLYELFYKRWPAAIAALIFAVHPLQTEAVTFISGLADPLSLCFILSGLIFFIKSRRTSIGSRQAIISYLAAGGFFMLSLLTKERSVVFPGLLIITDLLFWKIRESASIPFRRFIGSAFLRALPFITGSAFYLLLRDTTLNLGNTFNISGAATIYTGHLGIRLLTFFSILPTYFSLLFLPIGLHMERSAQIIPITTILNPSVLLGFLILVILTYFAVIGWKRQPGYSFGILWFLVALFPSSGILAPVAGIIYEHYLYVPLIGFGLVIGLIVQYLWPRASRLGRRVLLVFLAIIAALAIVQTAGRNSDWRDALTFYGNTFRYVPQSLTMGNNLAFAYVEAGNFPAAEKTYLTAIHYNPASPELYHNLGNLYYRTGRLAAAEKEYLKALELKPNQLTYYALYRLYLDEGELQKAAALQRTAAGQLLK